MYKEEVNKLSLVPWGLTGEIFSHHLCFYKQHMHTHTHTRRETTNGMTLFRLLWNLLFSHLPLYCGYLTTRFIKESVGGLTIRPRSFSTSFQIDIFSACKSVVSLCFLHTSALLLSLHLQRNKWRGGKVCAAMFTNQEIPNVGSSVP